MTTDRLTATDVSSMPDPLDPSLEEGLQAHLAEISRLLVECRRHTQEANDLIRQSHDRLATAGTMLKARSVYLTRNSWGVPHRPR